MQPFPIFDDRSERRNGGVFLVAWKQLPMKISLRLPHEYYTEDRQPFHHLLVPRQRHGGLESGESPGGAAEPPF
jgi:hypothetical protein